MNRLLVYCILQSGSPTMVKMQNVKPDKGENAKCETRQSCKSVVYHVILMQRTYGYQYYVHYRYIQGIHKGVVVVEKSEGE